MASDDDLQPLPPTLDDLHVPEKMQARCAVCGGLHDAEAVAVTPLGEQADGAIHVQISYRMPVCPHTPIDLTIVKTPLPQVTEAGDG